MATSCWNLFKVSDMPKIYVFYVFAWTSLISTTNPGKAQ